MSDLYIEARLQAIKDIASVSCTDEKDADNIASFCDEIYSAIPKLDKIVEELKEAKHDVCLYDDDLEYYQNGIDRAIEIVKQGGVSDVPDMCEWKAGKSNDEWQPNCEPNSTYNVFGVAWFKRCPYCGKKIKIVGD